jgi:hypothetical protein
MMRILWIYWLGSCIKDAGFFAAVFRLERPDALKLITLFACQGATPVGGKG